MTTKKQLNKKSRPKARATATSQDRFSIKPFLRQWGGKVIALVLFATYGIALYSVLDMNIIPQKYLSITIIASVSIVLAVAVWNLRTQWRSMWKSIALIACSITVLLANGYVYSISTSTSQFLGSIETGNYATEQYYIVTKKQYDTNLKNGQSIGYLKDDINNTEVLKAVKANTSAYQSQSPELASLTVALDDKTVDMVVMHNSVLELLEQNYNSFFQELEVLKNLDVRTSQQTTKPVTDITKPYAVYISGIDTYGEIGNISRSDVNIVAVINPQSKKVLLINTPRDYYVQLHDTTGSRDKLTHAGIYGPDVSRLTLQDLYQTPIDYSLRINFTTLIKTIDAIGGVRVYSDNAFSAGGHTYVRGYNDLNSEQALDFARTRKAFQDGDRTRGQNQQRVIEAIIAKLNDPRSLIKYQELTKTLSNSFQTNASKNEIANILKQQMNNLDNWKVESVSAEGYDSHNVTYSMGGTKLYVMEPNPESLNKILQKIAEYTQS